MIILLNTFNISFKYDTFPSIASNNAHLLGPGFSAPPPDHPPFRMEDEI